MSKPKINKFDEALETFKRSIKESMDAALVCSVLAITMYAEHDNLNWCQKFLDAMPKNFTRRAAFLTWLAAHSPILYADGKLSKDKAEDAVMFNLPAATSKSFWEYAPAKEDTILDDTDAFKRLMQTVKYFRRDTVKTSDKIKAVVNEIEAVVGNAQSSKEAAVA